MTWRSTKDYDQWRDAIVKPNSICHICSSSDDLHAHHVLHAAHYPDEKFNEENGEAMCSQCHSLFHNAFMGGNRKKCNGSHLERFKKIYDHYNNKGAENA